MQSFWQYLRRAAQDAVLAGIEDAVRLLEQGRSIEAESHDAGQLATRLSKVVAKRLETKLAPKADEASAAASPSNTPDVAPDRVPHDQPRELFDSETEPVPSLTASPSGHLNSEERAYAPRGKRVRRHHSRYRSANDHA